jgi:hypothetical protein
MITAHILCRMCEVVQNIQVDRQALENWRGGMYAQDAFPDMPPAERELFISGVCGPCFKKLFGNSPE